MEQAVRLALCLLATTVSPGLPKASDQPHSRQKRILWVTSDGRLALPPGTTMVINPSVSLPFVRHPPPGFFSNLTISLPFTINFDKLGLTDNENPYGALPPIFARSMGRAAGSLLGDYVAKLLSRRRGRRAIAEPPSVPPESFERVVHGGERALLYGVVEDFIAGFGMDGKACLLRAICEVHSQPVHRFGLLGEMLHLFFTASNSPFADLLGEYVDAEKAGKGIGGSSECWPYVKDCPQSLFRSHNHYTKSFNEHIDDMKANEIPMDESKVVLNEETRRM